MSSFHKTTSSTNIVNGTKIKNNLMFVSSGVPSLDHVIGGGLPIGTTFLIEEDQLSKYSKVLCKYFLAEGAVCNHSLFIASADDSPQKTSKEIPSPSKSSHSEDITKTASDLDKMKIAWRYEGLSQVESSFGTNTNFGHNFDLTKYIDAETLKSLDLSYWDGTVVSNAPSSGFKNGLYYDLLTNIKGIISRDEFQVNSKGNKNILRIIIQSLGSPVWTADDDVDDHTYSQDLVKFLYILRTILRDTTAVALVTIPSFLFEDVAIMKRLLYSAHNSIKLESFAGSNKETNPVFKEYNGLLHISKLSALNTLVQFVPPSLDLAFKLRRKKFVIEKLHLPPELQESSERENDPSASQQMSCGGFKKTDIEF